MRLSVGTKYVICKWYGHLTTARPQTQITVRLICLTQYSNYSNAACFAPVRALQYLSKNLRYRNKTTRKWILAEILAWRQTDKTPHVSAAVTRSVKGQEFTARYQVSSCINVFLLVLLMQSLMGTLNSPSSRIVKDSTPSRRRILRYINFGIGES